MNKRELLENLTSAIEKLEDYVSKLNEEEINAIRQAKEIIEDEY